MAGLFSLPTDLISDRRGLGGAGRGVAGLGAVAQEALHLEDESSLVFQLGLQLSDLSLELMGVVGSAVLVVGLQAFQADLKKRQILISPLIEE